MAPIKLGILRETKTPPDKRVPLTPQQCLEVMQKFPGVEVIIEKSDVRAFKDEEYTNVGLKVVDRASDCDILMGVKEVKTDYLIPNKKYFFFSHTFKKQPYNRQLLQTILEKKIQLIDYEILTDAGKHRIIGFGRFAGIVGTYNGLVAYCKKLGLPQVKRAHQCEDKKELEEELKKINLPSATKIVVTGSGRVGGGAQEILEIKGIQRVSPADFLAKEFAQPVYTQLEMEDYYAREDGAAFDSATFHKNGAGHVSTFGRFLSAADIYIPCHYWSNTSPVIVTKDDLRSKNLRVKLIADISCDIAGPIASTLRASTISDPLYGYDPVTEQEVDFMAPGAIGVMAIDNLPCELPKDASVQFGNDLIARVFPALFGSDPDKIIERASETDLNGNLMPAFSYLADYVSVKA
jgi:saccharopine dehydrogenase (NAD+, L-lysine forming)